MQVFDSLRRAFRWHRRGIAALLVAVAVLAGLSALTPRSGDGPPVVVARHDIAAGEVLTDADLALASVPSDAAPASAFADVAAAVGATTVVAVPARQVITPSLLLATEGQMASGRVALPVTFGIAATVGLLRVGSRIDVLGATASGAAYGVVAGNVRVAAIPSPGESGILGGGGTPLVMLEVTPGEAAAITAAMSVSPVSFALH